MTTGGRLGSIPRFGSQASPEDVAGAVREQGCAVLERLGEAHVAAISQELAPYLGKVDFSVGAFMGNRTRRTARLYAKSPATHALILDQLVQSVVVRMFAGECFHHQLHITQGIRIEPAQRAQPLHRDDSCFPFRHPCQPVVINTLWALTEFTDNNGATRVVLGSQKWDEERQPNEGEALSAVMPRGSVLIYDGAMYHGGGTNRSDGCRDALLFGYSLGWLRPEENPQLAAPPQLAKSFPKALQDLLGYRTHGYLGNFEGDQPWNTFSEPVPDTLPAGNLFDTHESNPIRLR